MAQVKNQYNLTIFYVKLEEKMSSNLNRTGGNLSADWFLCKLSFEGDICIILMMVRSVMTIFQINENIVFKPPSTSSKYIAYRRIFPKKISFNIITTCADAIYTNHLPCKETRVIILQRTCGVTKMHQIYCWKTLLIYVINI